MEDECKQSIIRNIYIKNNTNKCWAKTLFILQRIQKLKHHIKWIGGSKTKQDIANLLKVARKPRMGKRVKLKRIIFSAFLASWNCNIVEMENECWRRSHNCMNGGSQQFVVLHKNFIIYIVWHVGL